VQSAVLRLALRPGRPVRAEAFPAFGADGWVRVRGRVLVGTGPGDSVIEVVAAAEPPQLTPWSSLRANLSQFLTVEVPRAQVRVSVGEHTEVVVTDREGYLDAVLPRSGCHLAGTP
jgi:phosphatidate phosphatase APP1